MINSSISGTVQYAGLRYLLESESLIKTVNLFLFEQNRSWINHDSLHQTRRIEYPWALSQLEIDRNDILLDAGGGKTAFGMSLAAVGCKVDCIDNDPESVKYMLEKTSQYNYTNLAKYPESLKYNAMVGDITNLAGIKDNLYDKTFCISVLEHLPAEKLYPAIDELIRVTKHKIIITMDVVSSNSEVVRNIIMRYGLELLHNVDIGSNVDGYLFKVDNTLYKVALISMKKRIEE